MTGLFGSAVLNIKKKKKRSEKYKEYPYSFYGRELVVQGYERQALEYLVASGIKPEHLKCECEFGKLLNIRYTYGKKVRTYFPDIYDVNTRTVYEVKSKSTMGLLNNKKRGWSMNKAKAKACLAKGYKFELLLMTFSGKRIELPSDWYMMTKDECIALMERQEMPEWK